MSYRQLDLVNLDDVQRLLATIKTEHGQLNGILHSAGMISDSFILKKTKAEFLQVLAPKVTGTFNLDQASREEALDFFVLFSSMAAMGSAGQADYAVANGFMDQFAAYRNRQVKIGERHGHTRSINWGPWAEGGMKLDPARQEFLYQSTGLQALPSASGLEAFHRSLMLPYDQILAAGGDVAQLRRVLFSAAPSPHWRQGEHKGAELTIAVQAAPVTLQQWAEEYLRAGLSKLLQLPAHKIDPQAPLENYGIDSVLVMKLTNQMEETFGPLSKTLFFKKYQTIAGVARYLVKTHPAIIMQALAPLARKAKAEEVGHTIVADKQSTPTRRERKRFSGLKKIAPREIAVIGVAGRYPQAENLQQFWSNLKAGRDCITEVPPERWDNRLYYHPDGYQPGKTYSKWGGFITDVDRFDPLFFNISPKEAEVIDPQERLFLEVAWETMEDAGYSKERITGSRTGVFVGVMWGHYQLFGVQSGFGATTSVTTSSYSSIANRVSYFFDLRGPSIALDTMCSSSLTAIHLACEELRKGEIDTAIAGGVNVTVHPYKYISLSQGGFVASDGRCRSFGLGGDGYVPGEGVGAVLLKTLDDAVRDGDQVYAIIKSTSINHGGKTNGYSVPNPNAQTDLIRASLEKANIDPATLGYIETHGTGTSLGDPIEITGLAKAVEGFTERKQFIPIGSVKSNIGHLESAAGIAAVTKALLQIRHKKLVPSLHADTLNPNINFKDSPFYVQTELSEWVCPGPYPRRIGVSSFGAGGSNAHLILEEHRGTGNAERPTSSPSNEIFVLSARNKDALLRYAKKTRDFLADTPDLCLTDLAYTSQVGRTPMQSRLVVVTSSLEDLVAKLNQWIALREMEGTETSSSVLIELKDTFEGSATDSQHGAASLIAGQAGKAFLRDLVVNGDLEKIARLWILGVEIDWSLLQREITPRRVSFPTYPFAKEKCWVKVEPLPPVDDKKYPRSGTGSVERSERKQKAYYLPGWKLKNLAISSLKASAPSGPMLILDTSDGLFRRLKKELENELPSDSILLLTTGSSLQEVQPNCFTLDFEREDHFQEFAEQLKNRGLLPRLVLHHCAELCDLESDAQLDQQLKVGIYGLFSLCKALMKQKEQPPARIMSVFAPGTGTAAPFAAAMAAFCKTLALENPPFLTKSVDLSQMGKDEEPLGGEARLIWNEFCDQDWTAQEVRYGVQSQEGGKRFERYVRMLERCTLPEKGPSELPLRQKGVYLITGGLGGLGLVFAEYLARTFQAKLALIGRSAPQAKQEQKLREMESYGAEILVLQADVSKREEAENVVRKVKAQFSSINGVIHCAGVNRDAFIIKKTNEQIRTVLAPKLYGTINLDLATQFEDLDLFVLFSSVAGVIGNIGQSDYAYANHFLDGFAEHRENLARAGKRSGRTLSINWPLWEEGGMSVSQDDIALMEKRTGISPLPTAEGLRCWQDILLSNASQCVALYGDSAKIASFIEPKPLKLDVQSGGRQERRDATKFVANTEQYLKMVVGQEIKLDPDRIGSSERLESFGIDSIAINRVNLILERDLGALPKTLFYQYETVEDLAKFLCREKPQALTTLFDGQGSHEEVLVRDNEQEHEEGLVRANEQETEEVEASTAAPKIGCEPIAIIGIHGRYPHSPDLEAYWENLKQGRDLIDLVPEFRWSWEQFYDPDPTAAANGKIYCRHGGFIDDHDKFDADFFNISSEEAKLIDPQERLFLESVWAAIEDAGYTRDSLKKLSPKGKGADVGVFAGVTTNSYHLLGPEERDKGNFACPSAMPWSIANRVSYFFDFTGPSMPVDTACSSSLVALHLACESIRNGGCQVAIASGVNLYLHPYKYQALCSSRMLSLDGKCQSYGQGADGFVPGEGIGHGPPEAFEQSVGT